MKTGFWVEVMPSESLFSSVTKKVAGGVGRAAFGCLGFRPFLPFGVVSKSEETCDFGRSLAASSYVSVKGESIQSLH